MEARVRAWPRSVILRSSNIIGPPAPLQAIKATKFAQWLDAQLSAENEKPVHLFEDEFRSYVYVMDCVRTVQAAAAKFSATADACAVLLHMGGPESLTRVQMGRLVQAARGHPLRLAGGGDYAHRIVPGPRSAVNLGYCSPLDITMDSAALRSELGVETTSMAAAFKQMWGVFEEVAL